MPRRVVTIADVQLAVSKDLASGRPDAIPLLTAIADTAYKGNLVTERVADWVTRHTGADAYRDLVRLVHRALAEKTVEIDL